MPELKDIEQKLDGVQVTMLAKIAEAREQYKQLHDKVASDGADKDALKIEMERIMKRFDAVEAEWSRPGGGQMHSVQKTFGERMLEDPNLKNFLSQPYHKGGSAMKLDTFFDQKTTITSAAVGSATPGILTPERIPGIVKPGVRKLRVRDLMPRFPTSNNAIEFVKENAFTNTASPTAETISKPEAALTFSIDSSTVKTVALWIPMAKQIMADLAALSAYVNSRLVEGLKDVEDYELVAGDGTGQHISGLSTEATAYATARNVSGDTKLDTLNHAIAQIEAVLHTADGIILNPEDWRKIQLLKTEEGGANKGMYLLGGPGNGMPASVWGVPVATTFAVTQGTFYVGSFDRYTAVWDRMEAQIAISTEHADYFIRNMVAVLAEERIALTVTRSDAVVYGSFPS